MGRPVDEDMAIKIVAYECGEFAGLAKEIEKQIKALPSAQPEIIRCKDCKHSEHWYKDRRRCFLWNEDGVSVFDDGFCNYGELKQ